ncbi:hypothetical protein BDV96DRAFT_44826 [Lophiotrema nucula]|uniref:Uncharacterized protein n=1 Tax=Lophiotrema nucula TaxID=690887 RepID=A0A6A5ZCS7_9PLEO|nr:hypothetical protein BDV96DRAFT_44826 [Lophiotrema nucula]
MCRLLRGHYSGGATGKHGLVQINVHAPHENAGLSIPPSGKPAHCERRGGASTCCARVGCSQPDA